MEDLEGRIRLLEEKERELKQLETKLKEQYLQKELNVFFEFKVNYGN
jgi:hypothetical protein